MRRISMYVVSAMAAAAILCASLHVRSRAMHAWSREAELAHDAIYHPAIAQYQRALPLGIIRAEVTNYLDAHKVQYSESIGYQDKADSYSIKIAEEPGDGLVCNRWFVYLYLEFEPGDKPAFDKLKEIKTQKIGHCL